MTTSKGVAGANSAHVWHIAGESRTNLVEHLVRASSLSATAALAAYQSDDARRLLLGGMAAGLAVETALKASLASLAPTLIADTKKGLQSALLLAGSPPTSFDSSSVKTLGGIELVRNVRLAYADRDNLPSIQSCEQVLEIRNTSAHLGVAEPGPFSKAVVNMASIVSVILELMRLDDEDYWGQENLDLVTELLDEKASTIRLLIASKKANAQRRFEDFVATFPAGEKEAVFSSLEARFVRMAATTGRTLATCPVCMRDGLLELHVHEPSFDFSGLSLSSGPPDGSRYGLPQHFQCAICGLVLDDDEEIEEEGSFEDEYVLPPSDSFLEAVGDWEYEQRGEMEREFGRWD